MPGKGRLNAPQTLRQAKRAYRNSSKSTRLSAAELAAIERRAVLQERADRIKEREARRKANIKRKEDKAAREKARAIETGRAVSDRNWWKIGSSQLDLGSFLGTVKKASMGDAPREQKENKVEEPDTPPPTSSPLRMSPPSYPEVRRATSHMPRDENSTRMPPPARPETRKSASQVVCDQSSSSLKTENATTKPLLDISDDLFVSNTQIERELSPVANINPQAESSNQPSTYHNNNDLLSGTCALLLQQISTQDLDLDIDPDFQLSPPVMSTTEPTRQPPPSAKRDITHNIAAGDSFGGDDDLTDHDLEDLAQAVETSHGYIHSCSGFQPYRIGTTV